MTTLSIIIYLATVLFSVIFHEVAHGVVAYSMGDPTAKHAGRLTLNPIPHMDMVGSVLLPLLTFFYGGILFGYAKPVPYNPMLLNDRKYGPLKVALAGPGSNLLLALLFGLVIRFFPGLPLAYTGIFEIIVIINLGLAVFNLVPIPPLDGHQILFTLMPLSFREVKYFLLRYGTIILLVFVIFFSKTLHPLIQFLFHVIVGR